MEIGKKLTPYRERNNDLADVGDTVKKKYNNK